jgi:1-phosphatidylinositol-4-phosphate 5-kinase
LKDLNWVRRGRQFELGPEKRAFLEEQLRRDVELLARERIMDYSLLVGIHDLSRGNKDNLREQSLSMFKVRILQAAMPSS